MSWIESELRFANTLIFDHSVKSGEFLQDIYRELEAQLPHLSLRCEAEEPLTMPQVILPTILLAPPQASKRPVNLSPSPTRRSPDRKKPMLHRPITAPSFRSPLKPVNDNVSPRPSKVDLSVNSANPSPAARSSTRSPLRSSVRSPVRSPIRHPKVQLQDSPSKTSRDALLSRLLVPTFSSKQHANTQTPLTRKNQAGDQSTLQLRLNTKPQAPAFKGPKPSSGVPTLTGTPLLGASGIVRPIQSKIPVSVNTPAASELPLSTASAIATATATPFKFGFKRPLRPPAPSPSQVTLPDISDNDSGASLLRSWAGTPEVARQMPSQLMVDPDAVFGSMGPLEIDKIFAKPTMRGRGRTSSAAWEHDGLSLKERSKYTSDMGF